MRVPTYRDLPVTQQDILVGHYGRNLVLGVAVLLTRGIPSIFNVISLQECVNNEQVSAAFNHLLHSGYRLLYLSYKYFFIVMI